MAAGGVSHSITTLAPLGERVARLSEPCEGVVSAMRQNKSAPRPQVRADRRDRSRARTARTRVLRQTATAAERIAWDLLRKLRPKGYKFRRQHPIGSSVVDFCCTERRLIIELEGSVHSQPSQASRDRTRDQDLKRRGYTVARFPNGMVLQTSETFVKKVLELVSSQSNVFTGEP